MIVSPLMVMLSRPCSARRHQPGRWDIRHITLRPRLGSRKVQHMEEGYTQLGTVLTDQRPEDSEGDGIIVVGRFKGAPYDAFSSATTLAGETCT